MTKLTAGAEFITMGCRLNIAETEAMRGLVDPASDVVVINSCAVTNEAVRQTRQAIRRAKRARPDARVIVTGCAAQIDPAMFAAMPEVSEVLGNREKLNPSSFQRKLESRAANTELRNDGIPAYAGMTGADEAKIRVSDIMGVRDTAPHLASSFAAHARAFVEVQNGCDHRCTFCIIPYGRGNSRSVPAGEVVETIRNLVDEGYREVVLTGVDVTSYGPDLPGTPSFGMLVERILKFVPDLPRLRLSSLDGIEVDDRLFDLLTGEPRIMPHVHLSLQSGDDMILKRMKRRHSRGQAVELVQRLKARRPEIAIGADLIAGFPTEDDAMHANNLSIIRDCAIVHGHIFPYSARSGTPAARMPQVPPAVIKARAREMREAAAAQSASWLASLVGSNMEMLVERDGVSGHAGHFAKLYLRHSSESWNPVLRSAHVAARDPSIRWGDENLVGKLLPVRATAVSGDTLIVEPIA